MTDFRDKMKVLCLENYLKNLDWRSNASNRDEFDYYEAELDFLKQQMTEIRILQLEDILEKWKADAEAMNNGSSSSYLRGRIESLNDVLEWIEDCSCRICWKCTAKEHPLAGSTMGFINPTIADRG